MQPATRPTLLRRGPAILLATVLLAPLVLECAADRQQSDGQQTDGQQTEVLPAAAPASRPRSTAPTPRTGEWAEPWMERHRELDRRLQAGPVDVVFLGDSITHFWEPSQLWEDHGQAVWKEYFGDLKAVNLGVSGDQTGHLLWRLEHSSWEAAAAKVAVIMIGTNNLSSEHSAAEIAAGIEAVVGRLRELSPATHILLLGVFPREERPGPLRAVLEETNRILTRWPARDGVEVMILWDEFLDAEGRISPAIMPDFLHLSAAGYVVWAEAIDDKLDELLAAAP